VLEEESPKKRDFLVKVALGQDEGVLALVGGVLLVRQLLRQKLLLVAVVLQAGEGADDLALDKADLLGGQKQLRLDLQTYLKGGVERELRRLRAALVRRLVDPLSR